MFIEEKEEQINIRNFKSGGWNRVDNEIYDIYLRHIGIHACVVYIALCRLVNKKQQCFPAIKGINGKSLCEKIGIGKDTVIKAIRILQFFNIIKKKREGQRRNNTYTLIDKQYWVKEYDKNDLKEYLKKSKKSII